MVYDFTVLSFAECDCTMKQEYCFTFISFFVISIVSMLGGVIKLFVSRGRLLVKILSTEHNQQNKEIDAYYCNVRYY
jgi:hypothetical protein